MIIDYQLLLSSKFDYIYLKLIIRLFNFYRFHEANYLQNNKNIYL